MNPDATLKKEADNEKSLETKNENNMNLPDMKIIIKDNVVISEETRKKKT